MQPPHIDAIYNNFDRNLYKITGSAETDLILAMLSANPDDDNSSNVQTSASDIGSGIGTATTIQAGGSIQQGKTKFDNTLKGFILGTDTSDGNAKFYIGNTTQYLNWNGTNLIISGEISASSIDIPNTSTANSFHVDSNGNTWWGSTSLSTSTASITAAGIATFAGISSLNKKAYTNFETAARFVATVGGGGINTFANQGVTIDSSATISSFAALRWRIGNVLTNNPTFTCTIFANALNAASGSARCYFGLGEPTISGTGITYTAINHIGFSINKDAGTVTLSSEMGDGTGSVGASITTLADNDVLELFINVTATQVKFYYRKNGGNITLGDIETTHIPIATGEDSLLFGVSNIGTAVDFSLIMQCAAYEH